MGFWLWRTFKSQKSFDSDAQTEVIDLPKRGIISNLVLESYALSGSQKGDIMSQAIFSKIEVIGNGSTVIQSLTGQQVQCSQAYDDGRFSNDKEMSPSGGCYAYFDIRFGRYPGDQFYALDCSRWDSLELKITYNLAAGGTLGTTGFTTGTGKLLVYGLFSPDGAGISPIGYLKKEQKKTYTTTAGGTADLALPTDYPFRRLILLHSTDGYVSYHPFQYVTININNGARKPIDNWLGNDVMQMDLSLRGYPQWRQSVEAYVTSGDGDFHPRLGFVLCASVFSEDTTLVGGDIGVAHVHYHAGGAGSGYITAEGYGPDRSLCIDLEKWSGKHGREAMLDAWGYDEKADIHLEHTQQYGSIASQVVLEQYAVR